MTYPIKLIRHTPGALKFMVAVDFGPPESMQVEVDYIHCGPPAPYPAPPTPQQILDGASWFLLPRVDEDRELRTLVAVAEWELGLYD